MILQGVGHQISCLEVCYANDPPKRGVYDARVCAGSNNLSSRRNLHFVFIDLILCFAASFLLLFATPSILPPSEDHESLHVPFGPQLCLYGDCPCTEHASTHAVLRPLYASQCTSTSERPVHMSYICFRMSSCNPVGIAEYNAACEGCSRVHSTHAHAGMHMQQCSSVLGDQVR